MEFIAHLVFQLARNQFLVIGGLIMLLVLGPWVPTFFIRDGQGKGAAAGWSLGGLFLIGFPLIFGVAFFSNGVATRMVHAYGKPVDGLVTSRFDTSTLYNSQPVHGYNVILKRPDGTTVETSFRTDQFNVYPPRNETTYPTVGARFAARYLPNHPQDFVIDESADSPFSTGIRCTAMTAKLDEARSRRDFAPNVPGYAAAYRAMLAAVRAAGCGGDVTQDAPTGNMQ